MAQSDIYLRSERATAVGDLEVATGRDADADVRVNPNDAFVEVGGGDGDSSEGVLWLNDEGGDSRINLSVSGDNPRQSSTRVNVDGSNGMVQLGQESTDDGESDITLLPSSSFVNVGGGAADDANGQLFLNDQDGAQRIQLIAGGGGPASAALSNRIFLDGSDGELRLGASSNDEDGFDVRFLPKWAVMRLGGGDGENSDGDIVMADRENTERIHVDAGGGGPTSGEPRVYVAGGDLDPQDARDATRDHPVTVLGSGGLVNLGGDGEDGRLDLGPGTYDTITLDGGSARLSLGGAPQRATGMSGSVTLYNEHEVGTVEVEGADGLIRVGSQGYRGTDQGAQSGAVEVVHESGETTAELRGDQGGVVAGGAGESGSMMVKNADGEPVGLLEADGDELVLTDGEGTPVLRVGPGGSVDFPQGGP